MKNAKYLLRSVGQKAVKTTLQVGMNEKETR
jgi:hypothetical protein